MEAQKRRMVWPTWRSAEEGTYGLYSDGYFCSLGGASASYGPFATEEECLAVLRVKKQEADARYQEYLQSKNTPAEPIPAPRSIPTADCAMCGSETPRVLLMTSPRGAVCPDCYDAAEEESVAPR